MLLRRLPRKRRRRPRKKIDSMCVMKFFYVKVFLAALLVLLSAAFFLRPAVQGPGRSRRSSQGRSGGAVHVRRLLQLPAGG